MRSIQMTKAELVAKIAQNADLTKSAAETYFNSFLSSIGEILKKEQKVFLSGLGTLVVEARKERIGRNPRTGEAITIPAGKAVKFRPAKALKDAVR